MKTQLNDFEVLTLHEANNRLINNRQDKIFLSADYKTIRKNLPTLINKKLIHVDSLRYCGIVVLTEKGKIAAQKLQEEIEK